jgi:selenide,water dikinase
VKYGLAVTGIIHPDKVRLNNSLRDGDKIILTKPIGNGVLNTAMKGGMVKPASIETAEKYMLQLNKYAAEISESYDVSACTDVTGFGLGGHLCEMLTEGGVGIELWYDSLELLPEVEEMVSMGMTPAGTFRNKEYRKEYIENYEEIDPEKLDVIFDPQTSGGLLFVVAASEADDLLKELKENNVDAFFVGQCDSKIENIVVR